MKDFRFERSNFTNIGYGIGILMLLFTKKLAFITFYLSLNIYYKLSNYLLSGLIIMCIMRWGAEEATEVSEEDVVILCF